MKFSLGVRLKLLATIALLMMSGAVIITSAYRRQLSDDLRHNLKNEALTFNELATRPIGESFVTFNESGIIRLDQDVESFTDSTDAVNNVSVVDIAGNLRYQFDDSKPLEDIDIRDIKSNDVTEIVDNNQIITRIIAPFIESSGLHRYTIIYDFDADSVNKRIEDTTLNATTVAVFSTITIIISLSLVLEFIFTRRIKQIQLNALAIAGGNYDISLKEDTNDELGILAGSLNLMANKFKEDIVSLKELDQAKTKFIMIVSHNLHTPTAVIGDYVDTILLRDDLSSDLVEGLKMVKAHNARLKALTEDTILISNMESGDSPIKLRQENLNKFFERIATEFRVLGERKNLKVVTEVPKFVDEGYISSVYVSSAIWNILDNAIKFTSEGELYFGVSFDFKRIKITIKDTGIGIEEKAQEELFSKFNHGTDMYTYNFEGVGLGLYTTKLILDDHDGSIDIVSRPDHGTVVTITLPYIKQLDENSNN